MRSILACLALLGHALPAQANGAAAPAPAAPPPAASAAARSQPPARKAIEDPMDLIRERLAQKLGTAQAKPAATPGVVQVVNRGANTGAGVPAAAPAPRREPLAATPAHAAHWDYEGPGGPAHWGALKAEFATCARGTRQSPIDIRDGISVQLDPVQFDYRPSGFRVVDNGHTVQVDVAHGNAIEVLGRRYELQQFHFHRPSEERIDGRQFDMVAHLVHKSADARLAVVAVLLERGSAHPLVQTVWNNLPLDKGEDVTAKSAIDLNGLLPTDRSYYTYMGSLTTPPCSEGVLWMVMRQPVPISPVQIGVFARLYPMNARPLQQAGGRLIKQSE